MSGFKSAGVDLDQVFMTPTDLDPYIRGNAWVRGNNSAGQLMTGNTTKVTPWTDNHLNAGSGWVKVAVSGDATNNGGSLVHSAGIKRSSSYESAKVYTCGNNNEGQLGTGDTTSRSSPFFVGEGFVDVAVGFANTYIVRYDGYLFGAGRNASYELGLGLGDTTQRNSFVPIMSQVKQVSAGRAGTTNGYACAVTTDGKLFCWGAGDYGVLGRGSTTTAAEPNQVGVSTDWKQVACGEFGHTVGLKTDGTVWVWGLGSWFSGATTVPTQVNTTDTFTYVCAGRNTIGAIRSDGTLWAWGSNGSGELGDGTTTNRTTPWQISSNTTWKSVDMSYITGVAVRTDGTVWGWGWDLESSLGTGIGFGANTPVQITETDVVVQAAVSAVTSRHSSFIILTP